MLHDSATGTAKLFNPNPVVEHGGYSAGLRSDHNDRNTPLLTSLRRPVTLPQHRRAARTACGASGSNASSAQRRARVCRRSLSWNEREALHNRFEALMAYYHIDRAADVHPEPRLPTPTANGDRRPQPQAVFADAFSDDNSFYSPFDRERSSTARAASTTPRTPT